MNPELEALLRAWDAVTLAESERATAALRVFDGLIDHTLELHPGLERAKLEQAVRHAHARWLRAQEKPPSVPPKA